MEMTKFAQRIMTPLGIFAVVVWWSWAITGLFIGGTADFDQTQKKIIQYRSQNDFQRNSKRLMDAYDGIWKTQ